MTALVLALLLQDSVDEWASWSDFGEGSFVTFETPVDSTKVRLTRTLSKKEADRLTLTDVTGVGAKKGPPAERAVLKPDPNAQKPPEACLACGSHPARELKRGKEKLKVAGKELECEWTDEIKVGCDGKRTSTAKVWTHKDVPGWIVKVESASVGHAPLVLVAYDAKK